MKVLVISQYYYPEPFKIHEICEELVNRGHQVSVITGRPNYPDGCLYDGYTSENKYREIINGVDVIRTKIPLRGQNPLSLIRNYLSYPKYAKKAINNLNKEFDCVYVYQLSPVFMILPALYYKKRFGKKVLVYCLDLWPESLKMIHIKEKNPIYKIMINICKKIYKHCDFVTVTSPTFEDYLEKVNKVDKKKIAFLPQHGENFFLNVNGYQKQDKLNIVFAGNIGKAQDFDCLVKAVNQTSDSIRNKYIITIIGSGSYERQFKDMVSINNLEKSFRFIGRKRQDELKEYYEQASVFLLSLEKDSFIGKTIPGKLQTYMSAGRGIIGSIDGAAADIINEANAGMVCPAGDYKSLAKIIEKLINSSDDYLKEISLNSRQYFLDNFTIEKHVDELLLRMEEM